MKREETEKWKAIHQISKSQKHSQAKWKVVIQQNDVQNIKQTQKNDPNTFLEERKEARKTSYIKPTNIIFVDTHQNKQAMKSNKHAESKQ